MADEQLKAKIQESLNDGFSEQEIRQALRDEGINSSRVDQAFNQLQRQNQQTNRNQKSQPERNKPEEQNTGFQQNQNTFGSQSDSQGFSQTSEQNSFSSNSQGQQNSRPGISLRDNYYRIRQQLLLNRYSIYDKNDEKILKAKSKILSLKTNIPFMTPDDGEKIFRVISSRLLNISNNYNVQDERNGEIMAVLDRKRTLLNQVWRIRDPQDSSLVATIKNESTMLQFLRTYFGLVPVIPNIFALLPHTYSVTDVNDNHIGELEGELSIRDEYQLNLQDSGQLEREDMIASIIAIDALEGN